MTKLIEIETERLRLRQWRKDDLAPFAAINADPRVTEFFPEALTCQASDRMARKIRSLIKERGWGFWAVEVKGRERFIGFVGLHIPFPALPFSPCVEIGRRLATEYWGYGYATEAAHAALRFAFERLELAEIVSFTAVENWRSRKVMVRLGMKECMEFEHPSVPEGNPLRRHVLYRLERERWAEA